MNKSSLIALVFGLMLLGILFFLSGLLAGIHLHSIKSTEAEHATDAHKKPHHTPYRLPTHIGSPYATEGRSMPHTTRHLPNTPQRMVVVPATRRPSDYMTHQMPAHS